MRAETRWCSGYDSAMGLLVGTRSTKLSMAVIFMDQPRSYSRILRRSVR